MELLIQRNNLDESYNKAVQYEEKVQSAIQVVTDVTINSAGMTYDEINDAYNVACNDFISIFDTNVVKTLSDKIASFRKQLLLCQDLNSKNALAQNENRKIETAITNAMKDVTEQTTLQFNVPCDNFLSVFDSETTQSISEKCCTFREQILLCQNLNGKYTLAQNKSREIETAITNAMKDVTEQTTLHFNVPSDNFLSVFDSETAQSISEKCYTFGEQLLLCHNLNEKYVFAQNEKVRLDDELSVATQSVESEEQSLIIKQNEMDTALSQISTDFALKILSIDVESMLLRYRTAYRSKLRFFNSQYKSDRKMLLAYYKSDTKMSYTDTLSLLDKVYIAQCAKQSFEKQTETVNTALRLKHEKETEFSECTVSIKNLDDLLSVNKEKLEYNKHLVLSESTTAINNLGDSLSVNKKKLESDRQQFLSECTAAIKKLDDLLSVNKENLESIKQSLASNISSLIQDYEAELSVVCKEFDDICLVLGSVLDIEVDDTFNFALLKEKLDWSLRFQAEVKKYALGSSFAAKICECDRDIIYKITEYTSAVNAWTCKIEQWIIKFAKLFEEGEQTRITSMPLTELKQTVQNCHNNLARLEYLIDFRNAERRLTELGIDAFLEKAKLLNLLAEEIIPIFKKCFYRSWLDAVMPKFPSVNSFRRLRQSEYINQFRLVDKQHLEIAKATLIAKLISHLPNFDSFSANSGEVALLRREMAKQRKLMPIRKLIASIPNLLPAVKPCILMSPLSVSTYLGSSDYEFDTVIFDEASQVRTEDAVCSIFRAKQAIIVGDSNQLPPSDFFGSSISDSGEYEDEDGEINDAGAYESLLDESSMLKTQKLLWHYRSKHEHLIAFSNAKIYDGDLITFPSSTEKADGMGVEYIHVTGGMYDRGGKKGNQKEAEKIAEFVLEHFIKYPNRSLGIVAFGEVQQTAIEEEILRKRRENPQYEIFFKGDNEEAVFIKNLETVQGDERDTIIFSIGFAPDASGKFIMNFGPLSRNGGERRLNVAVTRARYNLKLVGSIMPTDIDADRVSGKGPKLLRLYIDFAIYGAQAILGETTNNSDVWFDSPFEEAVYNFVTANGYDVITQVGCSGYRIDMAVRHPKYNGRFAIGIECDGKAYHSARTARERDRLRQTVLEDMGWNIYRVWSTDWIKDQHTEGEALLAAIKQAIDDYIEQPPKTYDESSNVTNFLNVSSKSIQESFEEKYQSITSRYAGYNASEIPISDFEQTMLRVLVNSYGLDKKALFKETAQYGYLWQRQGSTIKEKFELAYKNLIAHKKIAEENTKLKLLVAMPNLKRN